MIEKTIATIAVLFVISSLCQWFAWKVKLPAIIFLLTSGILAGPVFGILQPDLLLGDALFPIVSLSVAVILFEGSLTLKSHEILGMGTVVRNMVSIGMLITCLITAVVTRYVLGLSWETSTLFGAVMVVTGPTVIVPMLRTVRPKASISNILRWEGIVIDPIGASMAVLVYEFIISGSGRAALGHTLLTFGQIIAVGAVMGALGGYLLGVALRNHWVPEYLHNVTTLAMVFGVFAASNMMQHESGLVTVTVMGIWMANMPGVDVEDILNFKESLSILLISILFILLAARMDLASFQELGWAAAYIFVAIQFIARPLNVLVSTIGSKLSWNERHILAWIAPRGIVAAALVQAGYEDARFLIPLTFMVIIGTVFLQSLTARPLALWLKVAEPEPRGFLIIGANPVARAIGQALTGNGFRVMLADTDWDKIAKAKMEGMTTYFGNPISEHADRHLDLVGIGRMLALTPLKNFNVASVMHYRMELGPNNVFILQSKNGDKLSEKYKVAPRRRGQALFSSDTTYASLASLFSQGAEIHTTKLTESFGFEDFKKQRTGKWVMLFAIDPKERLHVFTENKSVEPQAGWSLISLYQEQAALDKG